MASARPTGEMTSRIPRPDAGSHATHDRLAVAAMATGDLSGTDLIRTSDLVAACPDCGNLLAEIRSIGTATRHLPPRTWVAPRDFRISPDQASSLARGAGWRRILRPFGRQGNAAVRPLAAMFSTLGVAGLLLAALPLLPFAGGAASLDTVGGRSQVLAPTDATRPVGQQPEGRPPEASGADTSGGAYSGGGRDGVVNSPTDGLVSAPTDGTILGEKDSATSGPTSDGPARPDYPIPTVLRLDTPLALMLVSLVFLGAGLGLFLLQRAARRLR